MQLIDNLLFLEDIKKTENGFEATLRTNPEHMIYKAHFPGNPITPGVCVVQTAGELLERELNREVYLKNVKNVKFLSVIIPEKDKKIKYDFSNLTEDETECKVQVTVSDDDVVYAKMSLIFSYERL